LLGVPNDPNITCTRSCSTRSRVCSTEVLGFELSSREMNLTLRPLMPPRSLIMSKYAASALPIEPNAANGPV
jgi:hypothetical protein